MVALCAGLDVQHTLDHGDQLIGVQGAFRRRKSHAIENFRIAAGLKTGELYGMVFQDSDVAKWLAGAASSLAVRPDAAIEKTEQLAADVKQYQTDKAERETGNIGKVEVVNPVEFASVAEPEFQYGADAFEAHQQRVEKTATNGKTTKNEPVKSGKSR